MADTENFTPEQIEKIHKVFRAVLQQVQGVEFGIAMAALADAIGYATFKANEDKPHLIQRRVLQAIIHRQIHGLAYMQAQPTGANTNEIGHG